MGCSSSTDRRKAFEAKARMEEQQRISRMQQASDDCQPQEALTATDGNSGSHEQLQSAQHMRELESGTRAQDSVSGAQGDVSSRAEEPRVSFEPAGKMGQVRFEERKPANPQTILEDPETLQPADPPVPGILKRDEIRRFVQLLASDRTPEEEEELRNLSLRAETANRQKGVRFESKPSKSSSDQHQDNVNVFFCSSGGEDKSGNPDDARQFLRLLGTQRTPGQEEELREVSLRMAKAKPTDRAPVSSQEFNNLWSQLSQNHKVHTYTHTSQVQST